MSTQHHYHAVIWIDHREARITHFGRTGNDELVVHPHHPSRHIHHKANSVGSGHSAEDPDFFRRVGETVADAGAILITGPSNAKTELMKYIHGHNAPLAKRVLGVETLDHPTDGELLVFARRYFKAGDLMLPQISN